jgi:hypothetical protein
MLSQTGLEGPYPLERKTIDVTLTRASAGIYVLGNDDGEDFHIHYIGRSDSDVAARVREFVGFYSQFAFAYSDSANAAFDKECQLYHDFGQSLDSKLHPSRPAYSSWHCPRCSIFDY